MKQHLVEFKSPINVRFIGADFKKVSFLQDLQYYLVKL